MREKQHLNSRGKVIKMTVDFTLETMEAKGSNTDFFKSSVPNQNSIATENTLQE